MARSSPPPAPGIPPRGGHVDEAPGLAALGPGLGGDDEVTAPVPAALAQRWELLDAVSGRPERALERLDSLVDEFRRTLQELQRNEDELWDLRELLERAERELTQVRRESTRARRDAAADQGRAAAARREVGAVRVEAHAARCKLADARQEYVEERERTLTLEAEHRALVADHRAVEQQLIEREREQSTLDAAHGTDAERIEILEAENEALRAQVSEWRTQATVAEEGKAALERRMGRAKAGIRATRAMALDSDQRGTQLSADVLRLQGQLDHARVETGAAQTEIEQLRGQLESLRDERDGAAKDASQLRDEVQQEQAETAAHSARLEAALRELDTRGVELREALGDQEGLVGQIGQLQKEQQRHRDRARELELQLEHHSDEAEQQQTLLRGEFEEACGRLDALQARLDERTSEAGSAALDQQRALEEASSARSAADSARAEAEMARSLVDAQARELERVRSEAQDVERERDEPSAHPAPGKKLELARKAVHRYRRRTQHDRARWKAQETELGHAISGLFAVAHAYPRQLDEMETVLRQLRVILEGTGRMIDLHRAEAEKAYRALFSEEPPKTRVECSDEGEGGST